MTLLEYAQNEGQWANGVTGNKSSSNFGKTYLSHAPTAATSHGNRMKTAPYWRKSKQQAVDEKVNKLIETFKNQDQKE
jgi:hypothetical protein